MDRRRFLQAAAALGGGALTGGPLQTMLASAVGAAPPDRFQVLGPVEDLRGNVVRLHLPPGFQYRSFHDTEAPVVLHDGTALPGRHDGMAAFNAPDGNVWLVRNHEVNNPVPAFGPGTPYDTMAGGGTTTSLVTPFGEVLDSFTSLNGTQMNCSGGPMPWGSWITCEETVNGPDVGPDFTGVSNIPLTRQHGYLFEVPAGGQSDREPVTSAGRFAHEAAAYSPAEGIVYLTEDNFGFPSHLYRYIPATNPVDAGGLDNDGRLQALAVAGRPNIALEGNQVSGAAFDAIWVDIAEPDHSFPFTPGQTAPTTNNEAINWVGNQARALGAAHFSRLEGATFSRHKIYFSSTQGGGAPEPGPSDTVGGYGNGTGQIWSYDTRRQTLTCQFQSPGASVLDFPDNLTARNDRGTIVMCEDNINDNFVRGLTIDGVLFDIALNRLVSSTGASRFNDEFAGATFGRDETLFVNIQASRGMTFAIWGPWGRIGV
jgi:secreted PhoX family phosphatase